MKRWWLLIVLLASLGLNLGLVASRALQTRSPTAVETVPPAGGDPSTQQDEDRLPRVVYRMADELGLEGAKRAAFVDVQRTFFEQTISARSRMARLHTEVRREVTSENPDRQVLDQILGELSQAHTDLERAFVYNLLDSREILDVDQERRFRHFMHRLRQVRGDVEQRFRGRWRERLDDRRPERGRRRPMPGPGNPPSKDRPAERG